MSRWVGWCRQGHREGGTQGQPAGDERGRARKDSFQSISEKEKEYAHAKRGNKTSPPSPPSHQVSRGPSTAVGLMSLG